MNVNRPATLRINSLAEVEYCQAGGAAIALLAADGKGGNDGLV
jgi:hypothetical protein